MIVCRMGTTIFRRAIRLPQLSTKLKMTSSVKVSHEEGTAFNGKLTENNFFYHVLAHRERYVVGKLTSDGATIIEAMDEPDCLFEFLSDTDSKTLEELNPKLIHELVSTIPLLKPRFIHEIMLHMTRYEIPTRDSPDCPHAANLKRALDLYCSFALRSDSIPAQMTLADIWHRCGLARASIYVSRMLRFQALQFSQLRAEEVIQHLFFANIFRFLHPEVGQVVESVLYSIIPSLDFDEAALVCQALYKCKHNLHNQATLDRLIDVFDNSADSDVAVHNFSMIAFAKFLRGYKETSGVVRKPIIKRFLDILPKYRQDWSIATYARLANVGSQVRLCNEVVVREALAKALRELSTARTKYITSILFAQAYFNMRVSQDQARRLIEYFVNELDEYEKELNVVRATWALAVLGYFDERLYRKTFGNNQGDVLNDAPISFDLFSIWHAYRIEAPSIHKLVTADPERLNKCLRTFDMERELPRLQVRLAKELHTIVVNVLNLKATMECIIPMYVQKDIKLEDDIVLACHAKSNYYNDTRPLGYAVHRVRLIQASGFKVIEIPHSFSTSGLSSTEKGERLRALIAPLLNSKKWPRRQVGQRPRAVRIRSGLQADDEELM
ncbi:hypothetical protein BIW11_11357 [Tropilaelaps mercedesae]|uniref:RAP domain-containing protein n=1 Tax=Tropilaelaps mercedesae TaxID=418985 RepID=A0A1V9XBE3_9ACAR|nr:hypothetical protein BIW11_11357 [Tropilaelaps mercedesae]